VGQFLEDRYDYFIKSGVYVKPTSVFRSDAAVAAPTAPRCKNYGCNQYFEESENSDTACKHHVAPPIFHDRIKGWSCCKEKKAYDWEEFQAIEGCTLGRHSTVDPKLVFSASPTVAAAEAAEAKNPGPVIKSIDSFNKANPDAATAAGSALKGMAVRKSTRKADGTAKCQNKGCNQSFIVAENTPNTHACTYHKGQPVFHDAIKFWSCCLDKKCYDFEQFLAVPGCATGMHDDGEVDLGEQGAEQS
jgi:hypothetical protein